MYIYIVVEQYFDGCNFWDTEKEYYELRETADCRVLELEQIYSRSPDKNQAAYVKEVELILGD